MNSKAEPPRVREKMPRQNRVGFLAAREFNFAVLHQQTLRNTASFAGVGLHSGNRVNMTFLPAPPNAGIRFRRVDLEGKPEIEARIENVTATTRSTALSKGNAKILTVEHVLAAFAGRGHRQRDRGIGRQRAAHRRRQRAGVCQDDPGGGGGGRRTSRARSSGSHRPFPMRRTRRHISVFPHDGLKITCTSADAQRALHPVLQRRSDAGDVGTRAGRRAHLLLFRGDRIPDQERLDQGRQPGKRRGHPRRRDPDDRAAALSGGIRPAQNPGHHRRPVAGGLPDWRARHRRQAGPQRQLRGGAANRPADGANRWRRPRVSPRPAAGPGGRARRW